MRLLHNTTTTVVLSVLCLFSAKAQRVEYFWDTDPGIGKGMVLQDFTAGTAQVETVLDAGELPVGIHLLGLRTLNGEHFSSTYYRQFYVPESEEGITRIEYYWDTDPGVGKGNALDFAAGSVVDLSQSLTANGLATGMHTLYLRAVSDKHYSQTYARQFYVPATPHEVEAIEYWFDNDPGVGNAIQVAATLTGDTLKTAFDVSTDNLADGVHLIGLRTLTDGTWSETKVRRFFVCSQVDNYVTRLEYFWDSDPGEGRGQAVDITPGQEVSVDFEADMAPLFEGLHTLGLRAQSGSDGWSEVMLLPNIENEEVDMIRGDVNADGRVTISDAIATVNYIQRRPSSRFRVARADLNHDGRITITDVIAIVNIILQKEE